MGSICYLCHKEWENGCNLILKQMRLKIKNFYNWFDNNVLLAFKCKECSTEFEDKEHLENHKKVHRRKEKGSGYTTALNPDSVSLNYLNSNR
jgi:hypothetical protein